MHACIYMHARTRIHTHTPTHGCGWAGERLFSPVPLVMCYQQPLSRIYFRFPLTMAHWTSRSLADWLTDCWLTDPRPAGPAIGLIDLKRLFRSRQEGERWLNKVQQLPPPPPRPLPRTPMRADNFPQTVACTGSETGAKSTSVSSAIDISSAFTRMVSQPGSGEPQCQVR